ncbi:SMI1/KNR4 family protein [Dactylosporangium sp. CS-047395]|uniref:SMI1/KNR4 family protein n=1 Tax=Dactylosporangium sp. CS-047395 TaxID=3239936 RepID=UPI003D945A5E
MTHEIMIGVASFDHVAASFWQPGSEHLQLPPLTDELVFDAERKLKVTLPPDLLRLLRLQNGGVVADSWDACPAETNFHAADHVPFEHLYGIGPGGRAETMTLLDTPYLVQEWELPSPVVLLSGAGHSWIALDYRACGSGGEPAVVWIDNEMNHELPLAPDFDAFVERLRASAAFPE